MAKEHQADQIRERISDHRSKEGSNREDEE